MGCAHYRAIEASAPLYAYRWQLANKGGTTSFPRPLLGGRLVLFSRDALSRRRKGLEDDSGEEGRVAAARSDSEGVRASGGRAAALSLVGRERLLQAARKQG